MESRRSGLVLGLIAVSIFSGSMPATRAGVSGFDPVFFTAFRALLAAAGAGVAVAAFSRVRPAWRDLGTLGLIGACVVVGFPLFSALAMTHVTAARGLLFSGLLPLSTAVWAMVRGGERPRPAFWLFAVAGAAILAGFALSNGEARGGLTGDLLLLVAVAVCGLGYAEGAVLSRRLGGWQVICWALLVSAPAMALVAAFTWPTQWPPAGSIAWPALAYSAAFVMLIAFFFWYQALAVGGSARIGQLQMLQPLLGLVLAAALLHEALAWPLLVAAAGVSLCVAAARRAA